MADEQVKILIAADDQASRKFREVKKSVESTSKTFKESGDKARASTELIGTFANVLGGTGLGEFAARLSEGTDRLSQFSEVADESAAGALAFKASLAAAAGVLSFKVGEAIGKAVFGLAELQEQMEETKKASDGLNAALAASQQRTYSRQIEELREIADTENKVARATELRASLLDQQAAKLRFIEQATAQISQTDIIKPALGGLFGITLDIENLRKALSADERAFVQQERDRVQAAQEFVNASKGQLQTLNEMIGLTKALGEEEAKRAEEARKQEQVNASKAAVQSLRDELSLLNAVDEVSERVRQAVRDGVVTQEDAGVYERQLRLIQERKEAIEEEKRLARETAALKAQALREEQRKEQEIARTKETARKKAMAEAERLQELFAAPTSPLQAEQGRLLTRGESRGESTESESVRWLKDIAGSNKRIVDEVSQKDKKTPAAVEQFAAKAPKSGEPASKFARDRARPNRIAQVLREALDGADDVVPILRRRKEEKERDLKEFNDSLNNFTKQQQEMFNKFSSVLSQQPRIEVQKVTA